MFSFFKYIKNKSPKLNFFWFILGSIFRFFIIKLNINFYINQKISKYGPFKIHCFFAFSNFENWGLEESSVFPLMMKKCKKKKCIIDIGAHIGLTTLPIYSEVSNNSQIFSFEPGNINNKYLRLHLNKNKIKKVVVIDKLVGENNSKNVQFYESDEPTGMNSIINFKKNFLKKKKEQVCLDSFVKKNKIKPDLIKIDAEGSEIFILNGAKKILKKYKPDIFLSVHKKHFKLLGLNERDLLKIIKEIGYKIMDSTGKFSENFTNKDYYLYFKKNKLN